jgi:class 3 adenylate cyclase
MKTIGDAYLFACGVPQANQNHAKHVACSALEMIAFLEKRNKQARHTWRIRIGMHSGPVVGGVVGTEKYLYDIFGDTVNIAARMEELGLPMQVNVSTASHALLQDDFTFNEPRTAEVKGIGMQTMYTLVYR